MRTTFRLLLTECIILVCLLTLTQGISFHYILGYQHLGLLEKITALTDARTNAIFSRVTHSAIFISTVLVGIKKVYYFEMLPR